MGYQVKSTLFVPRGDFGFVAVTTVITPDQFKYNIQQLMAINKIQILIKSHIYQAWLGGPADPI